MCPAIDAEFVNALQGDIKVSPGDGTHFEILARRGLTDVSGLGVGTEKAGLLTSESAHRRA
jgi:hypothetical protein